MGSYSIKDLEKMSGIKAHTLRIWEKRHNLISPRRTETNIRYYTDEDLKKILNVSILSNLGLKISRIVQLSEEEICSKVLELTENKINTQSDTDRLILAMVELDEIQFERLLSSFILKYGFERTFVEIIYSFLDKIGVLWQTGHINPAHEHFVSNLIRQKLMVAIDGLPIVPYLRENSFILFLPEGEMHELGLLFCNFLIRRAGFNTFYLGQSVPLDDLKIVMQTKPSRYLMTAYVSTISEAHLQEDLKTLAREFPENQLLVSGFQTSKYSIKSFQNVKIIAHSGDLHSFLGDKE